MPKTVLPARRIVELDLLRGFFIIVIILDHLQFWPSPLLYLTGQGRLWVSAAEGFFIISGLLIGYLRAYKGARVPLKELSVKLIKRAATLWIWCAGITTAVLALTLYLPGDVSLLPKLPDPEYNSSLPALAGNILTMNYASDWIYFLRLYAIMLACTPIFLWCVRKKHTLLFIALMLGAYLASLVFGIDEPALQWQVLYFGAALVGWKLEAILSWLKARPKIRQAVVIGLIATTLSTMVLSYFMVHGWSYVESPATSIGLDTYVSLRANVDTIFSNNPMVLSRILLSFLWFSGLLALFHVIRKPLERTLGWLLLTFGHASLTAYCLQAVILVFIVKFMEPTDNFWLNGLVGASVVLVLWSLMKVPLIQKLLPK